MASARGLALDLKSATYWTNKGRTFGGPIKHRKLVPTPPRSYDKG